MWIINNGKIEKNAYNKCLTTFFISICKKKFTLYKVPEGVYSNLIGLLKMKEGVMSELKILNLGME